MQTASLDRNHSQTVDYPLVDLPKMLREARARARYDGHKLTLHEVGQLLPGKARETVVASWESGRAAPNTPRMDLLIRLYGLDEQEAWIAWVRWQVEHHHMPATPAQKREITRLASIRGDGFIWADDRRAILETAGRAPAAGRKARPKARKAPSTPPAGDQPPA